MKIFIKDLTKITDAKYSIGYKHNCPFDLKDGYKIDGRIATKEELEQTGKLIDYTGNLDKVLYYNPVTNTCYTEEIATNIDDVKKAKIQELSQACQNDIYAGFKSTAHNKEEKIYGSNLEDQANITGNALSAVSKVAGVPECQQDKFYYHAQGEYFVEWQASECLTLARDFKVFKETQLFKNKQLQAYADTLKTVEEVQKVTWDTVIPTT